MVTGTTAFYEGPIGVQRLAPLAQRLATDFPADPPRVFLKKLVADGSTASTSSRISTLASTTA